jgi:hypothetical protein
MSPSQTAAQRKLMAMRKFTMSHVVRIVRATWDSFCGIVMAKPQANGLRRATRIKRPLLINLPQCKHRSAQLQYRGPSLGISFHLRGEM